MSGLDQMGARHRHWTDGPAMDGSSAAGDVMIDGRRLNHLSRRRTRGRTVREETLEWSNPGGSEFWDPSLTRGIFRDRDDPPKIVFRHFHDHLYSLTVSPSLFGD